MKHQKTREKSDAVRGFAEKARSRREESRPNGWSASRQYILLARAHIHTTERLTRGIENPTYRV